MAKLERESQPALQRIEELIHKFESAADPATRADAQKLVQALMEFHGSGIERMMEIISEAEEAGGAIFDSFARDELVSSLLVLYGQHPLDLETRVAKALDKVRPILRAQGSNVHLLRIQDGVVQLRFEGRATMNPKAAIEEEIYKAAADVTGIRIEGLAEEKISGNGLIQLTT